MIDSLDLETVSIDRPLSLLGPESRWLLSSPVDGGNSTWLACFSVRTLGSVLLPRVIGHLLFLLLRSSDSLRSSSPTSRRGSVGLARVEREGLRSKVDPCWFLGLDVLTPTDDVFCTPEEDAVGGGGGGGYFEAVNS